MTVQDIGPAPDWCVQDHGSIITFYPMNPEAKEHGEQHFPNDCPMIGDNYCVEHRYATDIISDLMGHGFVVALDGQIIEQNNTH
jgi:hypothetical protein